MILVADYGSMFGLLVFAEELVFLAYCFVRGSRDSPAEEYEPAGEDTGSSSKYLDDDQERLDDNTRFLFDVVARQNEGIVQNIDALDNSLIAVVVGIMAVSLFAADKWFDLDPSFRFAGLFFLSESVVTALLGYSTIYFAKCGAREDTVLSHFAVDFSESPLEATSTAIAGLTRSAKANIVARRYKQTFVILATILTIVAAGMVLAGRALRHVAATSQIL